MGFCHNNNNIILQNFHYIYVYDMILIIHPVILSYKICLDIMFITIIIT